MANNNRGLTNRSFAVKMYQLLQRLTGTTINPPSTIDDSEALNDDTFNQVLDDFYNKVKRQPQYDIPIPTNEDLYLKTRKKVGPAGSGYTYDLVTPLVLTYEGRIEDGKIVISGRTMQQMISDGCARALTRIRIVTYQGQYQSIYNYYYFNIIKWQVHDGLYEQSYKAVLEYYDYLNNNYEKIYIESQGGNKNQMTGEWAPIYWPLPQNS